MTNTLKQLKEQVYDVCALKISNFKIEKESKEYEACQFELNGKLIICRNAKITPKKVGQFVTFWTRNGTGPIKPFDQNDLIDFYVVNVHANDKSGQFVFPQSVLVKKGIISTDFKEGKRGFRVYPNWDIAINKQAKRTQKWQLDYFYEINDTTNPSQVTALYRNQ